MLQSQTSFWIKAFSTLSFAFALGSSTCLAEHKLVFEKMEIDEREHILILETSFNPKFGWESQYQTLIDDIEHHKESELNKLCPTNSAIKTLSATVQTTPGLKDLVREIVKHVMEEKPNLKLELSSKTLVNSSGGEDDYVAKVTFNEAMCAHGATTSVRGKTVTPEMNFADTCIETSHFNKKAAIIVGGVAVACLCAAVYHYKSETVSCSDVVGSGAKSAVTTVLQSFGEDAKKVAVGTAVAGLWKGIPYVTNMIFSGRDDPKAVSYALAENIKKHREFCCSRKPKLDQLCSEITELEELAGEYKKEINRYYKQAGGWTYWATGYMSVHQDDKEIFIEKLNSLNDSNRILFRQCAHIEKKGESDSVKKSPHSKHKE